VRDCKNPARKKKNQGKGENRPHESGGQVFTGDSGTRPSKEGGTDYEGGPAPRVIRRVKEQGCRAKRGCGGETRPHKGENWPLDGQLISEAAEKNQARQK